MIGLLCFALAVLTSPFKSKLRLEAENAVLRHQLNVLRRRLHGRVRLTNSDRWFFIQLYRWFPAILQVLTIIRPETLVRWHRAGFRRYWRWKSNTRRGRPQIQTELRVLIRQMSWRIRFGVRHAFTASCLGWGFKSRSRVSPNTWPSRVGRQEGWCTFLRNHAPNIAAMDLFVVPTIGFKLLHSDSHSAWCRRPRRRSRRHRDGHRSTTTRSNPSPCRCVGHPRTEPLRRDRCQVSDSQRAGPPTKDGCSCHETSQLRRFATVL